MSLLLERRVTEQSREAPKRAADVLPFLAGSWKVERRVFEPDQKLSIAETSYESVADGKAIVNRERDACYVYSFDNETVNCWCIDLAGLAFGPVRGEFVPAKRSLLFRQQLSDGIEFIQAFEFVDANKINARLFHRDKSGKIVRKVIDAYTRLSGPVSAPRSPTISQPSPEMKVLDQLVGEWRYVSTVKYAAKPGQPKSQSASVRAESILGGRIVEVIETYSASKTSVYTFAWFDASAKQYREWYFTSAGQHKELIGTWNGSTKTLTWVSRDKLLEEQWIFNSDDLFKFRHLEKGTGGKVVYECTGLSRRVASDWIPLFNGKDMTGWTAKPTGSWQVKEGLLTGGLPGPGTMVRGDYANFHLRAEYRFQKVGIAHLLVRANFDRVGHSTGYAVELDKPGGLTRCEAPLDVRLMQVDNPVTAKAADWHTVEVIADRSRLIVKVDGKTTTDIADDKYTKGRVELHALAGTVIQFRKIEIKELPASPTPSEKGSLPRVVPGKK